MKCKKILDLKVQIISCGYDNFWSRQSCHQYKVLFRRFLR